MPLQKDGFSAFNDVDPANPTIACINIRPFITAFRPYKTAFSELYCPYSAMIILPILPHTFSAAFFIGFISYLQIRAWKDNGLPNQAEGPQWSFLYFPASLPE